MRITITLLSRWNDDNGSFGKTLYFCNLVFQSTTLTLYLFVSLFFNLYFMSYYFSTQNMPQGFSFNFARTLGRAVDKLFNASTIDSHRQSICGKQSVSLYRGNTAFQQNLSCNVSIFFGQNWTSYKWTVNYENRGLNIPFDMNSPLQAA